MYELGMSYLYLCMYKHQLDTVNKRAMEYHLTSSKPNQISAAQYR